MDRPSPSRFAARAAPPEAPCVVAGAGRAVLLTPDGELLELPAEQAGARLRALPPPLLVHAPATFRRLGLRGGPAFDLLELFAFVLPACAAVPTPRGLALALGLAPPADAVAAAGQLAGLATELLRRLAVAPEPEAAANLAALMGRAGWGWAPFVLAALDRPHAAASAEPLRVWKRLPQWEDAAPAPPPPGHPVAPADARRRLAELVGDEAEQRPSQADYASAAAAAFAPRAARGAPATVLAEAGTGTGKTLGYIAPASLWAERNGAPVWISTYTRHLQRQVQAELTRLVPEPAARRRRVVVRKGRENYLCLLNLEDAVGASGQGPSVIPLALLARWAAATEDGDMTGGDLPGWFADLFPGADANLRDRRGECIHGACPHHSRCFVEHTIRRARTADLVVANHALVMMQAAWGGLDDGHVPTRYVFDEGHHIFDAADSAFAAALTGLETAELRRWLLGAEGFRSRARGLKRRMEELIGERAELVAPLEAALLAARALPAVGWQVRMEKAGPELTGIDPGQDNPAEAFLRAVLMQVLARAGADAGSDLECDLHPLNPAILAASERLLRALGRLREPLKTLSDRLAARLEDEAEELESGTRQRIESAVRGLRRRALDPLTAWEAMLAHLQQPAPPPGTRRDHVDWLAAGRREGRVMNVGMHRHWLDPTVPFMAVLAPPTHGMLMTSATLRDAGGETESAWLDAEALTGAAHLPAPAVRAAVPSPFDYRARTRLFIVSDLGPGIEQLASAYRALFLAAGGGGLGLFTAISRLRAVHERIAAPLEQAGLPLLAQHVDAMDNATLVDVFRSEESSCLLGTDAMRDGVDVPGRALRLVVFEKVPWPRPDILHRERRVHLSGGNPGEWDARIARLRLRQAFGRLIRRADDRGVFVLLDGRTPSRLLGAFPDGVIARRMGLAEAVAQTRDFLSDHQ